MGTPWTSLAGEPGALVFPTPGVTCGPGEGVDSTGQPLEHRAQTNTVTVAAFVTS